MVFILLEEHHVFVERCCCATTWYVRRAHAQHKSPPSQYCSRLGIILILQSYYSTPVWLAWTVPRTPVHYGTEGKQTHLDIYMSADCLILLKQTRIANVYLGKLLHGTSKADTTTLPDSTAFCYLFRIAVYHYSLWPGRENSLAGQVVPRPAA